MWRHYTPAMRRISACILGLIVLTAGTAAQRAAAPSFRVDSAWPKDMPNQWIFGAITGVFVDKSDHVWVTHLPETLTEEELGLVQKPPFGTCCAPAPSVVEFDQAGKRGTGMGYAGTGCRKLSAESPWHFHRSQRFRLDRDLHAPSRSEVLA
jgi:hypothetical protein